MARQVSTALLDKVIVTHRVTDLRPIAEGLQGLKYERGALEQSSKTTQEKMKYL